MRLVLYVSMGTTTICSNQHWCRSDRPSTVRSVGKLLCLDALLTVALRLVCVRPFTVHSPPYTTSRVHAAHFRPIGCVTLCCAAPPTLRIEYMLLVLVR